jgi:hypothetical protein
MTFLRVVHELVPTAARDLLDGRQLVGPTSGEDDPNTSATVCIARRLSRRMLLRFGDGEHQFYYSNGEFRSAD